MAETTISTPDELESAESPTSEPAASESRAARIVRRLDLRWWEAAGCAALILAGLGMRLWDLGARAMHHDESLHAFYAWELSTKASYVHNPMMHGPFQFEMNAAMFVLFGDSEVTARLLSAIMGTVLIAMPFLFRSRLGRVGALSAALLLTASPALLYFSRFARNDILMAVWAFGLVICMWKYLDEGRRRYLYVSAGLLALAFATKESAYLLVGTLGLWCFLLVAQPHFQRALRPAETGDRQNRPCSGQTSLPVETQGVSPPVAIARVARRLLHSDDGYRIDLAKLSRPAAFLMFLITITLPQWSAFSSLFQETALLGWTNLVLAAPDGSVKIGDPVGGGSVIAFLIVAGLLAISIYFGSIWNWSVWWRCALIFYSVWTLLYTTFMTNYGGIKSGIWQALGYWVVQQGEGRGNQPWYYYFVITSVYEFLPFLMGIIGIVYFLRKRDRFSVFLVYWSVLTFLLYTVASEKMPWLLVNVTLPFIVMTGKFLGDLAQRIDWRESMRISSRGYLLIPAVPLFFALLWNLALYRSTDSALADVAIQVVIAAALAGLGGLALYASRSVGRQNALSISLLVVAAMLLALSVRAGVTASFRNGDTPVELIVYTQTSPDVTRLLETLEQTGEGKAMPIAIDGTSGFSWPWVWYLRHAPSTHFPVYNSDSFNITPHESVVVVHSSNRGSADAGLSESFGRAERIRHRWWFPEYIYRDLTPLRLVGAIFDRSAWRSAADYWLNREGVIDRLGSEDSYAYFSHDFPHDFQGAP